MADDRNRYDDPEAMWEDTEDSGADKLWDQTKDLTFAEYADEEDKGDWRAGEAGVAALKGYGEIPLFGFGDEISAAIAASLPAVGSDAAEGKSWVERYRSYRDNLRKETGELREKYPAEYYGGMGTGLIASAFLAPAGAAAKGTGVASKALRGTGKAAQTVFGGSKKFGAAKELIRGSKAAKGLGQAARAKELASQASRMRKLGTAELFAKGVGGGSLFGAGMSEADLTKGEVGEFAKDVGTGAALGGGLSLAPAAIGKVAAPVAKHPTAALSTVGGGLGLYKGMEGDLSFWGTSGAVLGGLGLGFFLGHGLSSPHLKNAAQLAWGGVKDFSNEALYSAKSLFTKRLNDAVNIVKQKFGISVEEQIGTLLEDSLKKIAQARTNNEDEIMRFVQNNLRKWGQEIGDIEQKATQGHGKLTVNQMFAKAKEIIEDNTAKLSPEQKQELVAYLESQFMARPARQVTERIVIPGQATRAPGKPTQVQWEKEPLIREYGGKGVTRKEAEELFKREGAGLPAETQRAKVGEVYGGVMGEEVKALQVPAAEPITEMPISQVKDIRNFIGNYAKKQEGGASYVANEIVNAIKTDMGEQLGKDWRTAAEKYYSLKEILRTLGADSLPEDMNMVTDQNVKAVVKNLARIFKDEDPRTVQYLMEKFENITPGMFAKMQEKLPGLYRQEKMLRGAVGRTPQTQLKAMRQAGIPEAEAPAMTRAEQTLEDVAVLEREAGTPEGAHKLVRDISRDLGVKQQARMEEVTYIRNLLKQYAPKISQELEKEGLDLSKFEGVVEAKDFTPLFHNNWHTIRHIFEPIFIRSTIAGTKLLKALKDIPVAALERVPYLNRFVNTIKQNPGLESAVAQDPTIRKLVFGISQPVEELSPMMQKYQRSLSTAAQRGVNALMAKHYILEQQDPEYREMWNETGLEE